MSKCRPYGYWVGFTAAISGFLQSYAASSIAGAMLFLSTEFHLTANQEGLATAIILLGALAGALGTGSLADRFGRKRVLIVSALIYIASSIPMLGASSFPAFLALRFLIGIALGITSLGAPLYLAEIAPAKLRGAFVASFQLAITLGTLAAYFVNFELASSGNWRGMLFVTALPALMQLGALFTVPESPKWLIGTGRPGSAASVLKSLHSDPQPSGESCPTTTGSSWKMMFSPIYRKGLAMGASLVILQQWSGINAIVYYAPKILQKAGFSDPKSAIGITFLLGLGNFLATWGSLRLIDRSGRRILLLFSQAGAALSLLLLTGSFAFAGAPYLSAFAIITYLLTFALGLGSVPWVVVSEIYPLAIRAHTLGAMTFLNWASNFLVVFSFPRLVASWGPEGAFGLYTGIGCASFILFYVLIPETKGKSLEEIELFLYKNRDFR